MNMLIVDELTQVYSFRSFLTLAGELIAKSEKDECVVVVWDIEHFKMINDMFGIEAGDQVLRDVSHLFHENFHEGGVAGRIGGDRFVCCYKITDSDMGEIPKRLDYRMQVNGRSTKIVIQAGIYRIKDKETPVIHMCDRAILALGGIKGNYLRKYAIYEEGNRNELREDLRLSHDFQRGITDRQFYLVVQPVYHTESGEIASGEVLVRWEHPSLGLVNPGRFIPLLEKNYLIVKLDYYVWEESCRLIRQMMDDGKKVIPLSVNVSRTNLYFEDLVDRLIGLVEKYEVPRDMLRLELTESAYMDDPIRFMSVINRLHEYGFRILMDDFGTGYSSLRLIKDFPFHTLKIDKSLIDEIGDSERAINVVNCIVQMSKWLGMEVVAEGVETTAQSEQLQRIGCDYIQGFLYAKPLGIEEFLGRR